MPPVLPPPALRSEECDDEDGPMPSSCVATLRLVLVLVLVMLES